MLGATAIFLQLFTIVYLYLTCKWYYLSIYWEFEVYAMFYFINWCSVYNALYQWYWIVLCSESILLSGPIIALSWTECDNVEHKLYLKSAKDTHTSPYWGIEQWPLLLIWVRFNFEWISDYIHYKIWDKITKHSQTLTLHHWSWGTDK